MAIDGNATTSFYIIIIDDFARSYAANTLFVIVDVDFVSCPSKIQNAIANDEGESYAAYS